MSKERIKLIINEEIVLWLAEDYDTEYLVRMLLDDGQKCFRDIIFGMLGDYIPLRFIDNWEEAREKFNKTTYKGMPLGDYYENENEIGEYPEHVYFDIVGAWWEEENDE